MYFLISVSSGHVGSWVSGQVNCYLGTKARSGYLLLTYHLLLGSQVLTCNEAEHNVYWVTFATYPSNTFLGTKLLRIINRLSFLKNWPLLVFSAWFLAVQVMMTLAMIVSVVTVILCILGILNFCPPHRASVAQLTNSILMFSSCKILALVDVLSYEHVLNNDWKRDTTCPPYSGSGPK